jgi:hypothetical protein
MSHAAAISTTAAHVAIAVQPACMARLSSRPC